MERGALQGKRGHGLRDQNSKQAEYEPLIKSEREKTTRNSDPLLVGDKKSGIDGSPIHGKDGRGGNGKRRKYFRRGV